VLLSDAYRNGAIRVAINLTDRVRLHLRVQREAIVGTEIALFIEIGVGDAVAASARILARDAAAVRSGS